MTYQDYHKLHGKLPLVKIKEIIQESLEREVVSGVMIPSFWTNVMKHFENDVELYCSSTSSQQQRELFALSLDYDFRVKQIVAESRDLNGTQVGFLSIDYFELEKISLRLTV